MSLAIVFPGQGSQSVGMLGELAATEPLVEQTFREASSVLGYDLWQLAQSGPEEAQGSTERTQPLMLAAGVAVYRVWRKKVGPIPKVMAGHSLGEYTALVCAESLEFAAAVELVRYRGLLMQEAVPVGTGAMAAILGLDDAEVIAACEEAAEGSVVSAANFNSPGQIVIAGEAAAVDRAIEKAKARGAKRAIKLPVSVPSHTALMRGAAERFAEKLQTVAVAQPKIEEIYTVDVRRHENPAGIRAALVEQLVKPVRWAETVRAMLAGGVRTIIECGPGQVLTGLNRRIERDKTLTMLAVDSAKSLEAALAAVK